MNIHIFSAWPNPKKLLWSLLAIVSGCVFSEKSFGQAWQAVGPNDLQGQQGFSDSTVRNICIKVDPSGIPYTAYVDAKDSNKVTVKKFVNGSWTTVGSSAFTKRYVRALDLAIDKNGVPYVAFQPHEDSLKVTVMKYVSSSWTVVGSAGFTSPAPYLGTLADIAITIDTGGNPYVVYADASWATNGTTSITVKKYTGSSWTTVGSPYLSVGTASMGRIAIGSDNIPYIAYNDVGAPAYYINGFPYYDGRLVVKKFTGGSWVDLGIVSFGHPGCLSLAVSKSNMPYVGYVDGYTSYYSSQPIQVKYYNSINWPNVGTCYYRSSDVRMALDTSDNPYVIFNDNYPLGTNTVSAIRFFNNTWSSLGTNISFNRPNELSVAFDQSSNRCYTAYSSHISSTNGLDSIYVKRYSCQPVISSQPVSSSVCANANTSFTVTADTAQYYRWQVNTGSGWSNIANNTTYGGSATKTLSITGAAASMNGYQYRCSLADVCDTIFSTAATLTVNAPVTPSVSVGANPGSTICSGSSVTFTATPTNGGSSPSYQWKLNGSNVGSNSTTYTNSSLVNGDIVTCVLTSNANCASPTTATATNTTLTVNSLVTPSVSVSATPGSTICSGTSVTFTATTTNGGNSPSYQWKLNGSNVGSSSTTYTNSSLANGDIVTCVLTSNANCASPTTATATNTTMTVNSLVTPSVSVSANPGSTICSGTSVTFTATATNGGSSPSYQWKLNGSNVGSSSTTYTNSSLANGDIVTCVLTSNANCASPTTATATNTTMTVNSLVTPSVSVGANPGSTICSGVSVTFTAAPTNGGSSPSYQWKLNGSNVGSNSTTYTNSSLANGDIVTCVLTSNANCASPTTATATNTTMTVNSLVTPSVSVSANPGNTICSGTSVTFTATPTNGGSSPSYQWKLNGSNVGSNSTTYTNSSLTNGDVVTCVLTSNANCASPTTATATNTTMTVNSLVTPSVSVSANPGSTICSGTSVTFTATPTNGGNSPSYQWKLNGSNVGSNSTTYTNSSLANGDVVTCVLTSNANCASPTTATATNTTMTVNALVTPSVSVSVNPGSTICSGASVTFTATPTNGGSSPSYQWKLNGSNVGSNSTTYSNSSLASGDVVTCVLTSNANCASPATATATSTTMIVNSLVTPSISIAANPGNIICAGTPDTFTASITNGGNTPTYQWKLNGVNAGASSSLYSNSSLANGDVVECILTTSASCASQAMDTSNDIVMAVNPTLIPAVTISANPGININQGQLITFTANVTNGGTSPVFQWRKNGTDIPNAKNVSYSANDIADNDMISVVVHSNDPCANPDSSISNVLKIIVTNSVNSISPVPANIVLFPNPNDGRLTLRGELPNSSDDKVLVEIVNTIGQLCYTKQVELYKGALELTIDLQNTVTQGSYFIKVKNGVTVGILKFDIIK